jgi:flagellar biosynthesis protein FlhF
LEQGLDEQLLKKTVTVCKETLNPRFLEDEVHLQHYLTLQLQAQIRVSTHALSSGEPLSRGERVVCLVGSSGSGKTNLCAKLAARRVQQAGRSVAWVCADTLSAGAIAEAELYTRAMGIPLHVAYTPAELGEILRSQSAADLVLVDTQACNPYSEGSVVQLGEYLAVMPGRSTYLVCSAASKDVDLKKSYAALKPFNLSGLAFTHLDETNTFGNVFNLAWHSRLPLAFFSAGPIVPDDLQPAAVECLTTALFTGKWIQ